MAIVKMKRLDLISLAAEKDKLLHLLQRVGCVEITEMDAELADPQWASLLQKEKAMVGNAKSKVTNVTAALESLKKYASEKAGLFIMRKDIPEEEFCDSTYRNSLFEIAEKINH